MQDLTVISFPLHYASFGLGMMAAAFLFAVVMLFAR